MHHNKGMQMDLRKRYALAEATDAGRYVHFNKFKNLRAEE